MYNDQSYIHLLRDQHDAKNFKQKKNKQFSTPFKTLYTHKSILGSFYDLNEQNNFGNFEQKKKKNSKHKLFKN